MYDYGPETDMSLELIDSAKVCNNGMPFSELDKNTKIVLQLISHAVYQLKDEAAMSSGGILYAGDILLIAIGNSYQVVMPDLMEAMHLIKADRSPTAFDIQFVSVNQLKKCQPFLDYAEWHAKRYGRAV